MNTSFGPIHYCIVSFVLFHKIHEITGLPSSYAIRCLVAKTRSSVQIPVQNQIIVTLVNNRRESVTFDFPVNFTMTTFEFDFPAAGEIKYYSGDFLGSDLVAVNMSLKNERGDSIRIKKLTIFYNEQRNILKKHFYYYFKCKDVCDIRYLHIEIANNILRECIEGYQGPNCDFTCDGHCFGKNCTRRCTCEHLCLGTTGQCLSKNCSITSYVKADPECVYDNKSNSSIMCRQTACKTREFGSNCAASCADGNFWLNSSCAGRCRCLDPDKCRAHDGVCVQNGCERGYRGVSCQEGCQDGSFGMHCSQRCRCIDNETCQFQNGSCPTACQEGYEGPTCSNVISTVGGKTSGNSSVAVIVTLFILIAIVGLGVYVGMKYRQMNAAFQHKLTADIPIPLQPLKKSNLRRVSKYDMSSQSQSTNHSDLESHSPTTEYHEYDVYESDQSEPSTHHKKKRKKSTRGPSIEEAHSPTTTEHIRSQSVTVTPHDHKPAEFKRSVSFANVLNFTYVPPLLTPEQKQSNMSTATHDGSITGHVASLVNIPDRKASQGPHITKKVPTTRGYRKIAIKKQSLKLKKVTK